MVDHGSQWQKVPKVSGFVGEEEWTVRKRRQLDRI